MSTEGEELLRETERRRLAALVARDEPSMEALHGDDYELITPGGMQLSRAEYLEAVLSGLLDYRVFEPEAEIRVRFFETAGIVRYVARIQIQLPEGLDTGQFWHTDAYEVRDGRWQAVWSHATRIREA
jgi:hypothetical protein